MMAESGLMKYHPLSRRLDLSDDPVHFVRRQRCKDAFHVVRSIVSERRLLGGTGCIKGGYRCACFTEAPLDGVVEVFWHSHEADLKVMPFGVMFAKAWRIGRGGRPVIYQADDEFDTLTEAGRYRHMRVEPSAQPNLSHLWARVAHSR